MKIKTLIGTLLVLTFGISLYYQIIGFFWILLINSIVIIYLMMKKEMQLSIVIILQWLIYLPLLMYHKYAHPLIGSGNDDLRFEKLATGYYQNYIYGLGVNEFQSSTTYPKLLGAIYYFFESNNELFAGLINITIHSLIIILLYKTYCETFEESKGGITAAVLVTVYPLTAISTVLTLRETLVTLFIMLFSYNFIKYYNNQKKIYIIYSILSIIFGSFFHVGMIGLILFLTIYFLVYSTLSKPLKIMISFLALGVFLGFILNTQNSKVTAILSPETNSNPVALKAAARADYLAPQQGGIFSNIIFKIEQVIYFMTKPFPWEIRSLSDIVGFLNVMLVLLSILLAIKLYKKTKNPKILLIILIVLVLYVVFAMGTYNYGTALRHRDKASLLLIMFIPYYFVLRRRRE